MLLCNMGGFKVQCVCGVCMHMGTSVMHVVMVLFVYVKSLSLPTVN